MLFLKIPHFRDTFRKNARPIFKQKKDTKLKASDFQMAVFQSSPERHPNKKRQEP